MKHYSISLSSDLVESYNSDDFKNANSVDVALGNISSFPMQALVNVIKLLPENLAHLDLSKCKLNQFPIDDLMKLMMMLPKGLKALDLGDNGFEQLEPADLLKLVISLPQLLETVDFKGCTFKKCSAHELEIILDALPGSLKNFDIQAIDLNRFSLQELQKIFRVLPKAQKILDLKNYCWDRMTPKELLQLLNDLPENLNVVQLNRKDLPYKDSDELLLKWIGQLGLNIHKIHLDYREISPNESRNSKIYKEIVRLSETKASQHNCWVDMGFIEPSDAKIASLEYLVRVLESQKTEALDEWKTYHGVAINTQRNRLHAFFYPHHVSQTQKIVDEIVEPLIRKK